MSEEQREERPVDSEEKPATSEGDTGIKEEPSSAEQPQQESEKPTEDAPKEAKETGDEPKPGEEKPKKSNSKKQRTSERPAEEQSEPAPQSSTNSARRTSPRHSNAKEEKDKLGHSQNSNSQYPYTTHDDILHLPYTLLSTKPASPRACLLGRNKEPHDPNLPGPGEYDPNPEVSRPSTHSVKMSSLRTTRLRDKEVLDVPYYDPGPLPSGRSTKISGPGKEPRRPTVPGPGQYVVPTTFRPAPEAKACTFGVPHKPAKPPLIPGPGAYEHEMHASTARSPRHRKGSTAPAIPRKLRPIPTVGAPGPGQYHLGSTFDKPWGACFPTIKGRLAHPMDDRNAAHECAKTSTPRDVNRKMKATPRC
jgi:hypothetical protein